MFDGTGEADVAGLKHGPSNLPFACTSRPGNLRLYPVVKVTGV